MFVPPQRENLSGQEGLLTHFSSDLLKKPLALRSVFGRLPKFVLVLAVGANIKTIGKSALRKMRPRDNSGWR
jgi:hypothetical protein